MKVAIAQINSGSDVERNLAKVAGYVERAAQAGAGTVVFPEATMLAFGSDLAAGVERHAESWRTELQWLASEHGITVVAGEFGLGSEGRVRNLLAVYTDRGERHEYVKIHLYDAFGYQESDSVEPGERPAVVNLDGVGAGLATCYDIRFPKLFAELSRGGAQVVLLGASWGAGEGKAEQWETLARARALDSNSYVVAVDQADPEVSGVEVAPDAPTGVGRSVVADPFGKVVARLGGEEELRVVDLDLDVVERAKRAIPVLENARLGY
ncbi:carbon-nitrogen hydrolase family protein [Rothia sp. AR01]|uniref:Carbon-nitrogen hydrolase family protein n=1 Tax=Rothia santali TaxID=2949643 RepID=A0A9X2HEC3_9MICC|nr:carbon-nitrogen hydrolase family protein [Rothia santali]MCP3426735.1 carbon-nitrogen hydrolase family protein [Rothia santali]